MYTASMVIESDSDPVGYLVGINETAFIQILSKPASLVFGIASDPTANTMTMAVTNAGAITYTSGPRLIWGDPGRGKTRNVQRRAGGNILDNGSASVALLVRAETRYIRFGGWGSPYGYGAMSLYSATQAWGYNPKPDQTGFNIVGSTLSGMAAQLQIPQFLMEEGQVVVGSERGGGPGSLRVATGSSYVEVWNSPCQIKMTSPNGAKWIVTPGAGGALAAVAG